MTIKSNARTRLVVAILFACFLFGLSTRLIKKFKTYNLKESKSRSFVAAKVLDCEKGWRTSVLGIRYEYTVNGKEFVGNRTFNGNYSIDFCQCLLESRQLKVIFDSTDIENSFLPLQENEFIDWGITDNKSICK